MRSLVPGRAEIARALELIANGEDINYNGAGGDIEFDENGDVVGTIEIWTISGGEIKSTGRFELPLAHSLSEGAWPKKIRMLACKLVASILFI